MSYKIEMMCPRCNGDKLRTEGANSYYCPKCRISFDANVILGMKINQLDKRLTKLEDVLTLKLGNFKLGKWQ